MTPDEYAAKRREYDHARYVAQREQRAAKHRERRANPHTRAELQAYERGYKAGKRWTAKHAAAGNFADFSVPIPPDRMARLLDPTLEETP